jgi:Putative F0F1-ATPase subunit Ca2+/Mg2+ transporter
VRDQDALSSPRYGIAARASAAGILFPVSIVAGYLLGKWIGGLLGLSVGAALGALAGFWNLYRLLTGLDDGAGK